MSYISRFFVLIAASVVIAGVVLSPIILQFFGKLLPLDVDYLAKLGGSYAAASAILSGLSLFILAIGGIYQVRQIQIAQLHSARSMQLELLRMSLESPHYRAALGDPFQAKSEEEWRLHAYLNLWTMYFQMAFLTGAIEAEGVRSWVRTELFNSDHGRNFWRDARAAYLSEQKSRKHKTFFNILEDEYSKKEAAIKMEGSSIPESTSAPERSEVVKAET